MYARDRVGSLVGTDSQIRRRNEDLTQEEHQARKKGDHGRDEEQSHGHGRVPASRWALPGMWLMQAGFQGCWVRGSSFAFT